MESMVLYEVSERIAYITLNRPDKRNALNDEMVEALYAAFCRAEEDEQAKVVVLQNLSSLTTTRVEEPIFFWLVNGFEAATALFILRLASSK